MSLSEAAGQGSLRGVGVVATLRSVRLVGIRAACGENLSGCDRNVWRTPELLAALTGYPQCDSCDDDEPDSDQGSLAR